MMEAIQEWGSYASIISLLLAAYVFWRTCQTNKETRETNEQTKALLKQTEKAVSTIQESINLLTKFVEHSKGASFNRDAQGIPIGLNSKVEVEEAGDTKMEGEPPSVSATSNTLEDKPKQ